MAEHLLDDPQVGPAFDQVGGEGMTESVRRNLLVDARGHRPFLHEVEDGHAAEGAAEAVQEKDVLIRAGGRFGPGGQVVADGSGGHFPERDDPLFVALADDIDITLVEVDVRLEEAGALAHAEAAAVQDFQDRAVPKAGGGLQVHGFHDGIDLFHRQDGGEVFAQLRGVDPVAGVVLQVAFLDAPVEERAQGAEQAGLGTLGEPFLDAVRKVFLHLGCADVGRKIALVRLQEAFHVTDVGCHRVRRHSSLDPEVVAEVLGEAVHQSVPYLWPYSSIWPR